MSCTRRFSCTMARNQQGIALSVSLFVMLMLALLGYGLAVATRGATRVSSSFKAQKVAFEAAEAGIEYAREQFRANRAAVPPILINTMLDDARAGGTLVNAISLTNFSGTTGIQNATTNSPFVLSVTLSGDGGVFQVFLTNDRAEVGGVTSATDTNDQVMLTSFGSGPNGVGFAAAQAEIRLALFGLPQLPSVITLPGPSVNFTPFSSNAHEIDGDDQSSGSCYPTIGVTSATALAQVNAAILGPPNRTLRYRTCDPLGGPDLQGAATVENFIQNNPLDPDNPYEPLIANVPPLVAGDPNLTSVAYLTDLVSKITAVADFTSASDPGFTLGTADEPKVVVIDGDFTTSDEGAGILVVTGDLTFNGNTTYNGLILAIGNGSVTIDGNGGLNGSMLVANTAAPWDAQGLYVGVPTYIHNGGGNAEQNENSSLAQGFPVRYSLPYERTAYQQLR